jgi:antitoxin FitA
LKRRKGTVLAFFTELVSIVLSSSSGPEANMATALVRDLDDEVYERLKARAAGNNRSLEAELREILVLASKQVDMVRARAAAEAMRRQLEGRPHSDSGEILAEERLR